MLFCVCVCRMQRWPDRWRWLGRLRMKWRRWGGRCKRRWRPLRRSQTDRWARDKCCNYASPTHPYSRSATRLQLSAVQPRDLLWEPECECIRVVATAQKFEKLWFVKWFYSYSSRSGEGTTASAPGAPEGAGVQQGGAGVPEDHHGLVTAGHSFLFPFFFFQSIQD